MKTLILSFAFAVVAFAQGQPVNLQGAPPQAPIVSQFFYSGTNVEYTCQAQQRGPNTQQKRSDSTLTSVVVLTNVGTVTTANAHGLYVGARVTITGATVDTDLNGTYKVLTTPSDTTYTITTASVANATYTESTLVIATNWPLLTASVWAIQVNTYDSDNLTGVYWANSSTGYGLACSARATY